MKQLMLSLIQKVMNAYTKEQKRFLCIFGGCIVLLFLIRLVFPSVRTSETKCPDEQINEVKTASVATKAGDAALYGRHILNTSLTRDGKTRKHKIYSVSSYSKCFPDLNDVQLASAQRLGITPIQNRKEAEQRKDELVCISNSPYYSLKSLNASIPYLVPRAQLLLTKIARNFLDSQYVKHVRPSKILVTSVLRTKDDVAKLQRFNPNATPNSCHCYGTTFDISYNKFQPVQDPDSARVCPTRSDSLRFILSEVLNDLRKQELCYVKYESRQGCYHITVR